MKLPFALLFVLPLLLVANRLRNVGIGFGERALSGGERGRV